jgi:hypothetical protein
MAKEKGQPLTAVLRTSNNTTWTTVNNRDKENISGNINDNVSQGTNDGKLWNEKFICT